MVYSEGILISDLRMKKYLFPLLMCGSLAFAQSEPSPSTEYTKPVQGSGTSQGSQGQMGNAPETIHGQTHRFGVHAALGVPHPLRVGVMYLHPGQSLSAEFNYGQYGITVQGTEASMTNLEVGLRFHPFKGAFYGGVYLGDRTVTAQESARISGQDITAKAEIKSKYLAPHVGWLWGADDGGFYSSVDLGWMSPSAVNTTFSTNGDAAIQATPEFQDIDRQVRDQGNKLGELSLPLWTIIKVGWVF